ncbi:MAG: tRNA (adenosine(37)-N6)-threonylcarbamoyltransferase complex dimerization subunit type 1 TsaB, partial [Spirochaetales bacterium]|nr:tRNA (adenosine(37)-N6)-threonylcarbamoyltransferase complex dimerization subunit type 1 TsaB [Candidatus Physcosoma equi]
MNILSIDTSTAVLSIALKTDKTYEERVVIGNFAHSENLLPEIKSLLSRAGLTLKDLQLLICTKGPGSFTGLRVGMASLKGISLGSGAPLVSVPTLSVIDEAASLWKGPRLAVIDARKKKFYFRLTNGDEVLLDDRDGNPEDIKEAVTALSQPVLVTGPDAVLF